MRNEDSQEIIMQRMAQAKNEISHYYEFDYLLVNDEFERLKQDALSIIRAQRLKTSQQDKILTPVLEELLKND